MCDILSISHLTSVPNFTASIYPIKLIARQGSILFTFGVPVLVTDVHAEIKLTYQFTEKKKNHGPTKPKNEMVIIESAIKATGL